MTEITTEAVNSFLMGRDPMERIISIECDYMDAKAAVIYADKYGNKRLRMEPFKPFAWVKHCAAVRMFDGNRTMLRKKLNEYGITIKALQTAKDGQKPSERLANGYKYLFQSRRAMSFQKFLIFFQQAGTPIYKRKKKGEKDGEEKNNDILTCSPVEQYMIETGRRLFKGYDNYDDLKRMSWDIETTGLDPMVDRVEQIGIRTNKGFEKVIMIEGGTEEEKDENELNGIDEAIRIFAEQSPDTLFGHNTEQFDWNFFAVRLKQLGTTLEDVSLKYFRHPIYKRKKESILKLGGEMETYHPTVMWGYNILDSIFAVRRAMAINSDFESANLKYATRYLDLNKPNRVYVPGSQISNIWHVTTPSYAFNDENGDWYEVTDERPLSDGYELKTGQYVVERYLLDDIWEADKVELALNASNFALAKMLPTTFPRVCTMGTAGIWKMIMLAWSYENGLAIPEMVPKRRFTGGLSRLLRTGFVKNLCKNDYNSLYPSITLTWNIESPLDINNIMLHLLEYILTTRERLKARKAEYGGKSKETKKLIAQYKDEEKDVSELEVRLQHQLAIRQSADSQQLAMKVIGNSFFGAYGASNLFPWGDCDCAENVTCIGRQSLRLMISHFKNLGYTPIVGDTDGFDLKLPEVFRYTDEQPYIGKGMSRNVKKDKEYTGPYADIAEFEETYFTHAFNGGILKMGIDCEEIISAGINFARKNYACLFPDGSLKKVGNTIKSRKMSGFLQKFINNGIDLLLHENGHKFLENYYNYIDDIYNYRIPIKDIASKGNIKKKLSEYVLDTNTLTKAGTKKSRQCWYELAIKNNLDVHMGDSIFYVNTGVKKSDSDVKRITHQFVKVDGKEVELNAKITRELLSPICEKQNTPYKSLKTKQKKDMLKKFIVREEDEILLNCKMVPQEIVNDDKDVLCSQAEELGFEPIEYNVDKYIDQFNKRITPLLVVFSKDIRDKILITNPKDRKYFTEEQSKLVSGEPYSDEDEDDYDALMTPERKEVEFWVKMEKKPPFTEEIGQNWDEIVSNYKEELKTEMNELYQEENEKYLDAIDNLSTNDIKAFHEEGTIPSSLTKIVDIGEDLHFRFKRIPNKTPSTGGYIFDDIA